MADKELDRGFVRHRFRDLEPATGETDPNKAYAEYVSAAPATPLLHTEVTASTTPVQLPTIPANARRVILYAVTNPVTFTDVASDSPSSSHGMIIPADTVYIYDTDPDTNFLLWAASATVVRIAYYG